MQSTISARPAQGFNAAPLVPDQVDLIERVLPKVVSVGQFADVVGIVLGRSVRIRTERPSPDIRFEVRP